jgi:molybdopterin converting factor subunit 1
MNVTIDLFARARDLAGAEKLFVELTLGATVADLRRELSRRQPAMAELLRRSAIAVNEEFAEDSLTLPLGARVALLPPVSGG